MMSVDLMSGGWMWLWGSIMATFWIAVICLVVWLVVRTQNTRNGGVS